MPKMMMKGQKSMCVKVHNAVNLLSARGSQIVDRNKEFLKRLQIHEDIVDKEFGRAEPFAQFRGDDKAVQPAERMVADEHVFFSVPELFRMKNIYIPLYIILSLKHTA